MIAARFAAFPPPWAYIAVIVALLTFSCTFSPAPA